MSEEIAEQTRGKRRNVALSNLYLDPNNFRFVDRPEYRAVPPERVLRRTCSDARPASCWVASRRTFETSLPA